jgi:hypothetical protein
MREGIKQFIRDALVAVNLKLSLSTSDNLNGAVGRALSCWPAHAGNPGFERLI